MLAGTLLAHLREGGAGSEAIKRRKGERKGPRNSKKSQGL